MAHWETAATLEAVGEGRESQRDGVMQQRRALRACSGTARRSSVDPPARGLPRPRDGDGRKLTMRGFVTLAERGCGAPVVLIVGTSMDAGKTVAGKGNNWAAAAGLRAAGAKSTGVGRTPGHPRLRGRGGRIRHRLHGGTGGGGGTAGGLRGPARAVRHDRGEEPDVPAAEAGASPLEPYNGDTVLRVLAAWRICASSIRTPSWAWSMLRPPTRPRLGPRSQHRRRGRPG